MTNEEKAKNGLVYELHGLYEYDGLTKKEIVKLIDSTLDDGDFESKEITKKEVVSKDKIFGHTMTEIVEFLSNMETKYGVGCLEEERYSYEDYDLIYKYSTKETVDDIITRLMEKMTVVCEKYLNVKNFSM